MTAPSASGLLEATATEPAVKARAKHAASCARKARVKIASACCCCCWGAYKVHSDLLPPHTCATGPHILPRGLLRDPERE